MTDLERRLAFALADMVIQNCGRETDKPDVYWTDFLCVHKQALMLLVEMGVMEDAHPEEKFAERWERLFYARFRPNWQWELGQREP